MTDAAGTSADFRARRYRNSLAIRIGNISEDAFTRDAANNDVDTDALLQELQDVEAPDLAGQPAFAEAFCRHARRVTFEVDETIFEEGSHWVDCFFVLAGDVKLERSNSRRQKVAPGEFLGLSSLIATRDHVATATAMTKVSALRIPGSQAGELLMDHPEVACDLIAAVVRLLRVFLSTEERAPFTELLDQATTVLRESIQSAALNRGGSVREEPEPLDEPAVNDIGLNIKDLSTLFRSYADSYDGQDEQASTGAHGLGVRQNNAMSLASFKSLWRVEYPLVRLAEDELSDLFKQMDWNNNGLISEAEFLESFNREFFSLWSSNRTSKLFAPTSDLVKQIFARRPRHGFVSSEWYTLRTRLFFSTLLAFAAFPVTLPFMLHAVWTYSAKLHDAECDTAEATLRALEHQASHKALQVRSRSRSRSRSSRSGRATSFSNKVGLVEQQEIDPATEPNFVALNQARMARSELVARTPVVSITALKTLEQLLPGYLGILLPNAPELPTKRGGDRRDTLANEDEVRRAHKKLDSKMAGNRRRSTQSTIPLRDSRSDAALSDIALVERGSFRSSVGSATESNAGGGARRKGGRLRKLRLLVGLGDRLFWATVLWLFVTIIYAASLSSVVINRTMQRSSSIRIDFTEVAMPIVLGLLVTLCSLFYVLSDQETEHEAQARRRDVIRGLKIPVYQHDTETSQSMRGSELVRQIESALYQAEYRQAMMPKHADGDTLKGIQALRSQRKLFRVAAILMGLVHACLPAATRVFQDSFELSVSRVFGCTDWDCFFVSSSSFALSWYLMSVALLFLGKGVYYYSLRLYRLRTLHATTDKATSSGAGLPYMELRSVATCLCFSKVRLYLQRKDHEKISQADIVVSFGLGTVLTLATLQLLLFLGDFELSRSTFTVVSLGDVVGVSLFLAWILGSIVSTNMFAAGTIKFLRRERFRLRLEHTALSADFDDLSNVCSLDDRTSYAFEAARNRVQADSSSREAVLREWEACLNLMDDLISIMAYSDDSTSLFGLVLDERLVVAIVALLMSGITSSVWYLRARGEE